MHTETSFVSRNNKTSFFSPTGQKKMTTIAVDKKVAHLLEHGPVDKNSQKRTQNYVTIADSRKGYTRVCSPSILHKRILN